MVDLLVVNGELALSTQPRQFEDRILSLFEKALTSVENIPQVERAIMKYLFWSHSPTLASVHKHDPKVLNAIQTAKSALRILFPSFPCTSFFHELL
jgi:dynein heavy chain, axonemal